MRNNTGNGFEFVGNVVDAGDGVHQALRIGVAGGAVGEDHLGGGLLDDLTAVHNDHVVCHLIDNTQIMGDKDDCGTVIALQVVHQTQDLSLNGNVQSGGGLVRDQNLGTAGQSHCDHNTLAHTTGQLVGILTQNSFGVGDLNRSQHFQCLLLCFLLLHVLVDHEGLGKLTLDGEDGVQAGHRLLEDDGDLVATNLVHLLLGQLGQVAVFENDLALGDIAVAVQQLQDTHCGYGLTGAGLTDDADSLAGLQHIGNIVNSLNNTFSGLKIGMKVFYF